MRTHTCLQHAGDSCAALLLARENQHTYTENREREEEQHQPAALSGKEGCRFQLPTTRCCCYHQCAVPLKHPTCPPTRPLHTRSSLAASRPDNPLEQQQPTNQAAEQWTACCSALRVPCPPCCWWHSRSSTTALTPHHSNNTDTTGQPVAVVWARERLEPCQRSTTPPQHPTHHHHHHTPQHPSAHSLNQRTTQGPPQLQIQLQQDTPCTRTPCLHENQCGHRSPRLLSQHTHTAWTAATACYSRPPACPPRPAQLQPAASQQQPHGVLRLLPGSLPRLPAAAAATADSHTTGLLARPGRDRSDGKQRRRQQRRH
jgi:hypothetical protein